MKITCERKYIVSSTLTGGKEAIAGSSANAMSSLDSRLEQLTMAMEQMAKDHKDMARSNWKLTSAFKEFLDEWAYFHPHEDSKGSSMEVSNIDKEELAQEAVDVTVEVREMGEETQGETGEEPEEGPAGGPVEN